MRHAEWQSRFAEVIKRYQRGAFAWGESDCCLFVCDVFHALTEQDPGAPFRGRYDSALGGARVVREFCGGGVEELAEKMSEVYGLLEVLPAFAQRGDIGLYRDPNQGPTLGVNIGKTFAYLMQDGMTYFDTRAIARAWRVG